MQARENAKMKVLLMKYIDKDDSLLCTSQLSMADASQHEVRSLPHTKCGYILHHAKSYACFPNGCIYLSMCALIADE